MVEDVQQEFGIIQADWLYSSIKDKTVHVAAVVRHVSTGGRCVHIDGCHVGCGLDTFVAWLSPPASRPRLWAVEHTYPQVYLTLPLV